jgi:hypothetical protein
MKIHKIRSTFYIIHSINTQNIQISLPFHKFHNPHLDLEKDSWMVQNYYKDMIF